MDISKCRDKECRAKKTKEYKRNKGKMVLAWQDSKIMAQSK